MIYATISGRAGKQTPSPSSASVRRPRNAFRQRLLNATGLAFNPRATSSLPPRRGQRLPHRPAGEFTVYAEGMGVATGAAFDAQGNLFVGDRSAPSSKSTRAPNLVHPPSSQPAAYHLAVNPAGTVFVTALRSLQRRHLAIEPNGDTAPGIADSRPQASLSPNEAHLPGSLPPWPPRLVRVTEKGEASLVLAVQPRRVPSPPSHHHPGHQRTFMMWT